MGLDLKNFGIRPTKKRSCVLNFFQSNTHPLSSREVYERLQGLETSLSMDRVTVYRILDLFTEQGVLHRIPSPDQIDRYCLVMRPNEHEHAHFFCTHCGQIECMDASLFEWKVVPQIQERMSHFHLQIDGLCESCHVQMPHDLSDECFRSHAHSIKK